MVGLKRRQYVTYFFVANLLQAKSKPELTIRFLDGYFGQVHGELVETDAKRITGAINRVCGCFGLPGQAARTQIGLPLRGGHGVDAVHVFNGIEGGSVFSIAGLHAVKCDDVAIDPTEQGHAGAGNQHQRNNSLEQGKAALLAA